MIKQRVVGGLFLSLLIGALAGCSSSGGDIGGLFPAPKFLKGSIDDNNIYTAQDKRFTVSVPHAQGTDDYRYMHVKEEYGPDEDYVSFGPGAVNQSIYRINFMAAPAGKPLPDLDTVAPKALSFVEQQAQEAYGGAPTAGEGSKILVSGHNAYHWELKQAVPSGKLANVPVNLVHELYLIDFGGAMATIWVQTEVGGLNGGALTPEQFAESLKRMDAPAAR